MENQDKQQLINNIIWLKQVITSQFDSSKRQLNQIKKNTDHIRLEDYLDITKDKNLDNEFYSLFGYDDEDIFEIDYEFMINNIY